MKPKWKHKRTYFRRQLDLYKAERAYWLVLAKRAGVAKAVRGRQPVSPAGQRPLSNLR